MRQRIGDAIAIAALGFTALAGCTSVGAAYQAPSTTPPSSSFAQTTPAAATTSRPSTATPSTAAPSTTVPPPAATPPAVDPNAAEVNPAGDIPDNQVFVTYASPGQIYSIQVPEGWARTVADNITTFTDNFNTVQLQEQPAPASPTVASAAAVEVPQIVQQASGYQPGTVSAVTRKAGPAILVTYRADSPPNPVTAKVIHREVERFEFWHNGTEVIVTLAGPVGADNVDPWRVVTDSLRWL
jgi:hypothetical protein